MIESMTGYGKAECVLPSGKIAIEIRTLNGKNADVNIKTQLIPREKEMEIRKYLASELNRGTIELFANYEENGACKRAIINTDLFKDYAAQIAGLSSKTEKQENPDDVLTAAILQMPNVIEAPRQELSDESWNLFFDAIRKAVKALKEFRAKEGAVLYGDVSKRALLIASYIPEVEKYESERIPAIRERLLKRMEDLKISHDENRLEQELVYYLEKLDINEEKVRLRQHCKYFLETIEGEQFPGKKLGFIAQEMGREINTLGSKANHAEIQKVVVKMKYELDKIKEQSLNIL
ncbi:MAG: YicC family protein [Bacteroidales bacterium]|jgi:uncharacterized protein (TIGR00255 family)|nr:YicC family protein [Bacteroidales bacterium]